MRNCFTIVVMWIVLAGGSLIGAPALAQPQAALASLAAAYDAFEIAEDPFVGEREGAPGAASRLPDASPEARARRAAAWAAFRAEAEAIPEAALDATDRATRALLLHELTVALDQHRFGVWRAPFSNDSGFHTTLDYAVRTARLVTVADADALLARYRDVPRYFDENIAAMRLGLDEGWSQPGLVVDRVIQTLEGLQITGDPRAHPLYAPFAQLPSAWPEAERARIADHAQKALVADVGPAFARVLAFFRDEYRPRARQGLGISEVPGGRDYYAAATRTFTTLDVTPEEVHALGLAEVERIRGEMASIVAEVGFEGTFAEFLQFLRTDPQFYAESPEDLLEKAARIAKLADDQMPALFGRLPRLPYGVRPVPDAIAPAYTTGRYWAGDLERGVAGAYMVNTYDLAARPLYELPALTLHEGVPGHHHQIALAQELDGLPAFRKRVYVTAFGEGWGLYSEFLGYEMGIYRTPYERFGALSYEMWRACRLVVDTGLHWFGWTRAQAEACFLENSALSIGNITTEVDRYIAWPGQALAYKVGELRLRALRAEAEASLGEAFDVRAFHDMVLEEGAVPLSLLEEKVRDWIDAETR